MATKEFSIVAVFHCDKGIFKYLKKKKLCQKIDKNAKKKEKLLKKLGVQFVLFYLPSSLINCLFTVDFLKVARLFPPLSWVTWQPVVCSDAPYLGQTRHTQAQALASRVRAGSHPTNMANSPLLHTPPRNTETV